MTLMFDSGVILKGEIRSLSLPGIKGLMLLSEQLCTCPFLKPSLTQTCYQLSVVVLGEGWVHSFLDTVIDSNYFTRLGVIPRITI